MAKKAKRFISSLLALTMMVSSFAMANVSSVFASGNTIDVWDFGGVEESDTSLYTNHITKTTLDNMTQVSDGSSSYKASKGQFETAVQEVMVLTERVQMLMLMDILLTVCSILMVQVAKLDAVLF